MIPKLLMRSALLASVGMSFAFCDALSAQSLPPAPPSSDADASPGDIIVTARKREETSIAVPVAITAVGGPELERRGVNGLDDLAHLVPNLNIADGGGTVQGGTVALRGIAGPDSNPLGDQAVAFNIDNMEIAKSSVRRLGNFDLAQIEVLKGPQTLFFGKNSPGGVITMRTADPTDHFEAKVSAGYEINAHEWRTDGYISGPLTSTLGARLAWYTSDMRGWSRNLAWDEAPKNSVIYPTDRWGPSNHEYDLRGTLVWKPNDRFSARAKFTYGRGHGADAAYNFQYIYCPYGSPQFAGVIDNCKADNLTNHASYGSNYQQYDPLLTPGPYSKQNSQLASLEINYQLTDQLKLTSVSGFYRFKYLDAANFDTGVSTESLPYLGIPNLPSSNTYYDRELSEEVRLQSDFDFPINFTVGGIYSNTHTATGAQTFANPITPVEFNQYDFNQHGMAYSFFGQIVWQIVPKLELSGGGRYSHEEKRLVDVREDLTGSVTAPEIQVFPPVNKIKFNDFSPEITLSYRPSSDLTVYGSYKRGFLSGGFNGSSVDFNVTPDLSYGPEKVRGFEGGVKASLFDHRLRLNVAAYSYQVLGLQITSYANTVGTIRNAGKVKIQGIDFDFNYKTPIPGLGLHGGTSFLRGRYEQYLAPCYAGQTAAMGCDLVNNGAAVQDLSNTTLRNAPRWNGFGGFNFDMPINSGWKMGLSTDVAYTSSEITDAKSTPHAVSPARALIDATLRLATSDDRYEIALIGTNLSDKHYWTSSQEVPLTGNGTVNGNPLADLFSVISRGRQVMIRGTVKFGK